MSDSQKGSVVRRNPMSSHYTPIQQSPDTRTSSLISPLLAPSTQSTPSTPSSPSESPPSPSTGSYDDRFQDPEAFSAALACWARNAPVGLAPLTRHSLAAAKSRLSIAFSNAQSAVSLASSSGTEAGGQTLAWCRGPLMDRYIAFRGFAPRSRRLPHRVHRPTACNRNAF
jgi:hypothetical protein